MKVLSIVGLVLIVLGIIGFAYQGITFTKREKVVDIGPLHASKDTHETIPISPFLSGLALAGGVVLLIVGSRSRLG
jgi:hypothetical protein